MDRRKRPTRPLESVETARPALSSPAASETSILNRVAAGVGWLGLIQRIPRPECCALIGPFGRGQHDISPVREEKINLAASHVPAALLLDRARTRMAQHLPAIHKPNLALATAARWLRGRQLPPLGGRLATRAPRVPAAGPGYCCRCRRLALAWQCSPRSPFHMAHPSAPESPQTRPTRTTGAPEAFMTRRPAGG